MRQKGEEEKPIPLFLTDDGEERADREGGQVVSQARGLISPPWVAVWGTLVQ